MDQSEVRQQESTIFLTGKMAKISPDIIDRIRDSTDILDVVSEYVELRHRGKNYFGLCPFHTEKTPSFSVALDKQIFHCFGCGRGGNVITFLMEYEKVEFVEAIQNLGKRIGIEVEFSKDDKKKEFFTQLYDLHTIAVKLYKENLQSKTGGKVRNYLKKRGLSKETIDRFNLGYATSSWDQLFSVIAPKNIPDDVVQKSGLFSKSDKGVFDRFRDRIMFPIKNRGGRVVAFGGRDLGGSSDAKYLNSPETPIYNKSEILYGLSITKDAIRKEKSIVVVEGYMDLLQLYQHGILNVVATSGTALTEKHVNEIRKFTNVVYLAYDGDVPGRKATIRAGYNLLKGGLTPEIIEIPEGLDPDSWIKNKGTKEFMKAKDRSIGLIDFHIKFTELDLSKPVDRSQLAREIIDEIVNVKDIIVQQFTLKQITESLSMDEKTVKGMLSRKSRWINKRRGDQIQVVDDSALNTSFEKAQRELIRLLVSNDSDTISFIKKHVDFDHFTHPVMKTLAERLIQLDSDNFISHLSGVLDQFEDKSEKELAARLFFETTTQRNPKQVAIDCLITLEQTPIKQSISEHRIILREMEKKGEDTSNTLSEVVTLQKALKTLEQKRVQMLNL